MNDPALQQTHEKSAFDRQIVAVLDICVCTDSMIPNADCHHLCRQCAPAGRCPHSVDWRRYTKAAALVVFYVTSREEKCRRLLQVWSWDCPLRRSFYKLLSAKLHPQIRIGVNDLHTQFCQSCAAQIKAVPPHVASAMLSRTMPVDDICLNTAPVERYRFVSCFCRHGNDVSGKQVACICKYSSVSALYSVVNEHLQGLQFRVWCLFHHRHW